MSKDVMKRTVDKIKSTFWEGYLPEPVKCKYPKCSYPCSDLPDCRDAQQALDKKAENARELGLDYEPVQQEPVAYLCENAVGHQYFRWKKPSSTYKPIALYTSPPAQRTWVGLTDEEVINVMPDDNTPMSLGEAFSKFADLIEAKLKEKNT